MSNTLKLNEMKKSTLIFAILMLFMVMAQAQPPNPPPRNGCPDWVNTLPTEIIQTSNVLYFRTFEADENEGAVMKWETGYVSPLLTVTGGTGMAQSTWYSQELIPNVAIMLSSTATPIKGNAYITFYVTKEGCPTDSHTIRYIVTSQIVP